MQFHDASNANQSVFLVVAVVAYSLMDSQYGQIYH